MKFMFYQIATLFVDDRLAQISNKDASKILNDNTPPNPSKAELRRRMLAPYTPTVMLQKGVKVDRIPNMTVSAAKGIIEALEAGWFGGTPSKDKAWLSILKHYEAIKVMAR